MPNFLTSPESVNSPRLRVLRDEDAIPYDAQHPKRSERFVIVDYEAGSTILGTHGASAFAVYWHLCSRANQERECWPSLDDIAEATCLSRMHVTRMLKVLEEGEWIARHQRTNRFGRATSTLYEILEKPRTDACNIPVTSREHGRNMTASQMLHEQESNKNQTRVKREEDSPPTPSAPKAKKPLPENGPEQQMVAAFCRAAGIERPAIYPKAIGNAKQLIAAGVTIDDVPALYAFTASIWKGGADLGNMVLSVDRWRANKGAPTAPQNGHRKISVSEQNAAVFAKLMAEAEAEQHGGEVIDAYAEVRR